MADQTTQAEATQPEVSAPVAEATTDAAPAVETTKDEPVKADQTEEASTTEKNGDDAGAHKSKAHGRHHDSNKRKFDPSVQPITDNPQLIRVQVQPQPRSAESTCSFC